MAWFRSSPDVPLDPRLASCLAEDNAHIRKTVARYQDSVLSALAEAGEKPVLISLTWGGDTLLLVSSESVYEFKNYRISRRFLLTEVFDVNFYHDDTNEHVKYLSIEPSDAERYLEKSARWLEVVILVKMSPRSALVTMRAINESIDPRAKYLKDKYSPSIAPANPGDELGVLRLWTAGPIGMARAIAVAWKPGSSDQFEDLYRGDPNFPDETVADLAEAETLERFDKQVAVLLQEGWRVVEIQGRNLHFQRT